MRATGCHYCPGWLTGLWLGLGLLALVLAGGCRRSVPVVDLGPKPPAAMGTIAGIVRGSQGSAPFSARTVEVTNDATGDKHTVLTTDNGGFSVKLPAGKYRLDLQLLPGEAITKRPGIVVLDRGDIDSHVEFVLSTSRVTHSKGPAYRVDNGLGAPIA